MVIGVKMLGLVVSQETVSEATCTVIPHVHSIEG